MRRAIIDLDLSATEPRLRGLAAGLALMFLSSAAISAAKNPPPVPVSPGRPDLEVGVEARCPTFSWGTVAEADSYELVVFSVREEDGQLPGAESDAVLRARVPGAASSWTPPAHRCLARGHAYAWSLRARTARRHSEWSEPSLFRVDRGPTLDEVEQALATLRAYTEQSGARVETTGRASELSPERPAPTPGSTELDPSDIVGLAVDVANVAFQRVFGIQVNAVTSHESWPAVGISVIAEGVPGWGDATGISAHGDVGVSGTGEIAVRGTGRIGGSFNTDSSTGQALTATGGTCCSGGTITGHLVQFRNTAQDSGGDVLALSVKDATPTPNNNFITFFANDGATLLAEIEANNSNNGVICDNCTVTAPGADFAEYFDKRDPLETLEPGDVVGMLGGRLALDTRGAERILVVSTEPIVLGNKPAPGEEGRGAPVALLGQVPVRVRGKVAAGDYLVPSGDSDGTAVALREVVRPEELRSLVGQALESSDDDGIKPVRAMIGSPGAAALHDVIRTQDALIDELQGRLERLESGGGSR